MHYKQIGNERIQLTPEEETEREEREAAHVARAPIKAFIQLRRQRNRMLDDSDWVVTKATEDGVDVSDSWKSYRTALRNLPAQFTAANIIDEDLQPVEITWPTPPD